MQSTLVIQSHTSPLPWPWIAQCLESVRQWAAAEKFDYWYLGDEIFDLLPGALQDKTRGQRVIASDIARLRLLQKGLTDGYQTVIWCDADLLIFDGGGLTLPEQPFALGREVWVQYSGAKSRTLEARRKAHNAFMMFRRHNVFLDFYADAAERLVQTNSGSMPPQFVGPKLLTALHNIVACPVAEQAGMLSPLVIADIARGGGPALELMRKNMVQGLCAANLCASLGDQTGAPVIENCIEKLLVRGALTAEQQDPAG